MNEFNWEILERRMAKIQRSLRSFQENRPWPIEELQVWMLGDMCSGSNHPEIVETNEYTAAEQGIKVGRLLGQWLEELVPYYPAITVHGVAGNHPRLSLKPASKNVFNNFDWVAYQVAETYLRNYDVKCVFPRSAFSVAEIAGLKHLLTHGDGIRSTMPGVPWGGALHRPRPPGVRRPARRAERLSQGARRVQHQELRLVRGPHAAPTHLQRGQGPSYRRVLHHTMTATGGLA
jgi:hypothetical protein